MAPGELLVVRPSDVKPWTLERLSVSGQSVGFVPTPMEGDASEVDVRADGSRVVYVLTREEDDFAGPIWTTDFGAANAVPQKVPVDGAWSCPRWLSDGESIVALDSEGRPAVLDVESGERTMISLPGGATDSSCADPSPDGTRVALAIAADGADYNGDTWSVNLGEGDPELLGSVPEGCISNFPAWGPAGVVVVDAICVEQEHNGLWILDGDESRQLVGDNASGLKLGEGLQYWAPTWIDARSVAFHRVRGVGTDPATVWKVDLDGVTSQVTTSEAIFPSAATGSSG